MKHYKEVKASEELPPRNKEFPNNSIIVPCWFGHYWGEGYYRFRTKTWTGDNEPEYWLKEVDLPSEDEPPTEDEIESILREHDVWIESQTETCLLAGSYNKAAKAIRTLWFEDQISSLKWKKNHRGNESKIP